MSMAHPEPEAPEADSLGNLEDRIHRTVELVATLKAERDAALHELSAAKAASAELAAAKKAVSEVAGLRQEIEALRAERKQVRVRIEKLLAQIDQIGGQ